jgi:hypothetical protein
MCTSTWLQLKLDIPHQLLPLEHPYKDKYQHRTLEQSKNGHNWQNQPLKHHFSKTNSTHPLFIV